ncbi:MAG: hypothetical protein AB7O49_09555 [Sphingomonadales bacterium]
MVLGKTEIVIMTNASRRESRALLPLPRFIFVRGLSVIIAIDKLVRLGFAAERPVVGNEPVWRTGHGPMTLELTASGLAALGGRTDPAAGQIAAAEDERHHVLMSIISRPQGADLRLIQHETSLPLQSVRAAISDLRAEGYVFDHVRDDRGATTYQLLGWLPGNGGAGCMPAGDPLHA